MTPLIIAAALAALLGTVPPDSGLVPPVKETRMHGLATHYPACANCGAASGELQDLLGRRWKGSWVEVTNQANGRSVTVRLDTGCGCGPRRYHGERRPTVIDLSRGAFSRIASLGTGVIDVTVEPVDAPSLPNTDTAP